MGNERLRPFLAALLEVLLTILFVFMAGVLLIWIIFTWLGPELARAQPPTTRLEAQR